MPAGISKNPFGIGQIIADELHARVHMGQFFSASYIDTAFTNAEVADCVLEVLTPAHLRFAIGAGNDALVQLYENAVYTVGTPVTPANHNRFSSLTSKNLFKSIVTVSDVGDFLEDWIVFGGSGPQASGGNTGSFSEWILPPGDYLIRVTNLTSTSGALHKHLSWYEPNNTV